MEILIIMEYNKEVNCFVSNFTKELINDSTNVTSKYSEPTQGDSGKDPSKAPDSSAKINN